MNETRIAGILRDVEALKTVDYRERVIKIGAKEVTGIMCRVHGALEHHYEFAAPITDAELVAFENRLGACLPDDYREWITCVGDGGAGPMHGVIPLGDEPENVAIDYSSDFPFIRGTPVLLRLLRSCTRTPGHLFRSWTGTNCGSPGLPTRTGSSWAVSRNSFDWRWGRAVPVSRIQTWQSDARRPRLPLCPKCMAMLPRHPMRN